MATPGVDFFRVDRSRSTKRLLVVAAVLVAVGATSAGAHLVHRLAPALRAIISLAGGALALAGLVLGFGTMGMMLFEDIYLHIREEGLLVHQDGKDTNVTWDRLSAVDVDAARGLVTIRAADAEPVQFHAGASAADVARRIEEAKRKAALGILREP